MNIDPRRLEELRHMPTDKLVKAVQKLEAKHGESFRPGSGNARAEGNLEDGVTSAGFDASPLKTKNDLKRKLAEYKQDADARFHDFDVEPLKKRTERERVQSMTKRLMDAIEKQPWEAEMILKGAQLDEWKRGNPISFDALQQAAAPLIQKAAKEQGSV